MQVTICTNRILILDCVLTKIQILENNSDFIEDGVEIIGVQSAATCSSTKAEVKLIHSNEVSESRSLEMENSMHINWGLSASVNVEASASFFGIGASVSAGFSVSTGGGVTNGRTVVLSETESVLKGSEV